jgi:hypothetical protein
MTMGYFLMCHFNAANKLPSMRRGNLNFGRDWPTGNAGETNRFVIQSEGERYLTQVDNLLMAGCHLGYKQQCCEALL